MQAVTMLVQVTVLVDLVVSVNATIIGVLAYPISPEIALNEFAPLRSLGSTPPINLVIFINMPNVLIEVYVTVTLGTANAFLATKEKVANVQLAPMIALVTDNAPTSKIFLSKLL